jgi:hypothetical protein
MKSRLISLTLAALLALAVSAFGQTPSATQPARTPAAPKLVINKTQYDFGDIKKGQAASYSFTFKNEGKAELQILNVAPS